MVLVVKYEKIHDIGKLIFKIILGLIFGVILLHIIGISVFLITDRIAFDNSRSEGYKIAQQLVKSKKLTKMNYDEIIELLNDYHGECDDFARYIREYDTYTYDSGRRINLHVVKCHGGSAYSEYSTREDYIFQVTFDENMNVYSVSHYTLI